VYAVTIPERGGPEVLTWSEVDDPVLGLDEVLIDVAAAGVNRADLLQRAGFYPPPPGAPPYPGMECSGVVAAVGSGAHQWQPGEQVCALLAGGGYAQRVAVHQSHVLRIPRGVSLVDAAALPEVACTVWSNVFDLGNLQPLDTLLVHGGASGIGTFAIQLANVHGSRVITTARAEKHAALQALGAEITVDYTSEDFVTATLAATGNQGANVILDIMGASYLDRNIKALATGGRLVIIGLQGGRKAELDLGTLHAKRGFIIATTLRSRPDDEKAAIVAAVREHVWPPVESGLVRPIIHTYVPMPDAAQAHEILEASSHIGKVLLVTPTS
jgi:putative PIG3 family NAD(P)H quinone oxidoreductase